jgi:hypothetical protein
MGYALALSPCFRCGITFTYNPMKVPSVRDKAGVRQPLCRGCVAVIQAEQRDKGLPVWPDPLPGAYEACPEEELG